MEKEFDAESLEKDLEELCAKHGIIHASFCGTRNNKMVGLVLPGIPHGIADIALCLESQARAYQSLREKFYKILDNITK